jgi:ADYC domain
MVPSDLCGDGRAHTREGTQIDVYDRLGIQKREPAADMVFEAGWSPHGAVYYSTARRSIPDLQWRAGKIR